MGRWAQRQRTSGASDPPHIIKMEITGPEEQLATFDRPYPLPGPAAGNFLSKISAVVGDSINFGSPTTMEITYPDEIDGDTSVDFTPTNPNYQTQTDIPLT